MKVQTIQALRGPNYWSHSHPKLIQVRLELEDAVAIQAELLKRFNEELRLHLPQDFRLQESTNPNLLDLFCATAMALQNANQNHLAFFTSKSTLSPGISNVVFEYQSERAGRQAAKSAVALINRLIEGEKLSFNLEQIRILALAEIEKHSDGLMHLIDQAKVRNIPFIEAEDEYPFQFGYGKNSVKVDEAALKDDLNQYIPEGSDARIPIIAISGSNGKTTSTRLIAHILDTAGYCIGFTTSDGIYIDKEMVDEGDTTGPSSAQIVLRSKKIDTAVLESARGGLVRAGLGFDLCDYALITNVQGDHLGISDIDTIEELTQVKAILVKALKPTGQAILNADNENTIKIGQASSHKLAWFSLQAQNPILWQALEKGQTIAYQENEAIFIQNSTSKTQIAWVKDIPITFNGSLKFMIQNALGACLTAHLYGISAQHIAEALKTFLPSREQTPGRMNLFEVKGKTVLIDFAHNPDGFEGIRDYLATVQSPMKIGIIVGTGDRLESDLVRIGEIAAEMFDHIIIQQIKFLRGRTAESIVDNLRAGIMKVNPNAKWERISDDEEALAYALSIAPEGAIITALSNVLNQAFDLIKTYQSA